LKKQNDLSTLTKKIAHKSVQPTMRNKFDEADAILGVEESEELRERVIRKSYALTKHDLGKIKAIKDKCLNQKVVLSDSHVIRLALELATKLSEDELILVSSQLPKISIGRPKGS
jgi:hypothetical protein